MLQIKNYKFDLDLYFQNICIDETFNQSTKKDTKNKIIEKIYSNKWLEKTEKNLENIYQILIEQDKDFKTVFENMKLKDLITSNPNELKSIVEKIEKNITKINNPTKISNLKNTKKDIFKYEGKFKQEIDFYF